MKIKNPVYFLEFRWLLFGGLILIFALNSCNPTTKLKTAGPYFDLKSYFEKKESGFLEKKRHLHKILFIGGKKQSLAVLNPDWSRELIFFVEADINKPAWAGKFKSEWNKGNLTYIALDTDKINIRRVDFFHFNSKDSSFDSVRIFKKEFNYLSNLQSILVYKPDTAYSIIYNQDIRFYQGSHYTLQVKIKP